MAERIFVNELLTHTDWLRRLARELVRDQHTADDLAQSSLTAALSAPPRRRGSSLRGWLHRVMVNRLRQSRRNDGTRERLHRNVARAAEAPSTLTVVARTEIQGALIQALLALEEPYRTTILHRYYDNRSAAEIARADDLSESTVRNRLHRGLARLRERLRRRYGEDDTQWLPAVVALGLPEPVGTACNGGLFLRLAKSQKLAFAGVSLIGLAVLGTLLVPSGGLPTPPETVLTSDVGGGPAATSSDTLEEDPVEHRLPLQRAQLTGSDTDTFELRVLGPDAAPAPQARVRFVPLAHAQQQNLLRRGPQHPHSEVYRFAFLAEEYGEERLADDNGRVWLPVESDRLLVSAWHESTFATITVPGQQRDPMTVHLALDETLELRSVDRAGLPEGNLPLRVAVRVPGKPDNTLWIGVTDDLGVATVPHFQLLRPGGAGSRTARYGVCFDFPVRPHVTVGFEDPLPTAPLILTAPPHGVLDLSFTDSEGGPLVMPIEYYRLRIDLPGEKGASDAFPPEQGLWVGGFPLVGEHSVQVPIGLDALISATAQFRPMGEIEEGTFPGPIRPGEVVARELRLSPRYTVVRGELRGDGLALAGGVVARAVLIRGNDQLAAQAPTLLPGGAFELVGRATDRPADIYLHVRDSRGAEFAGEVPLPQTRVVDLGTVELSPLTVAIVGTVVDDRGLPVAGAEIQAWRRGNGEWMRDRRFQTVADGDGSFRLSVRKTQVGLGILPRLRGYLVDEPLPPGPEPLRMVRAGEISGSLLVPEWLEPSTISVLLLPLEDAVPAVSVEPERQGDRVPFRARDLWRGRYRALLQLDGEPEPFRDLGVFEVQPAEATAGDRLNRVDVGFDLFRLELKAVDELGSTLDLPGAGLTAFVPRSDGTLHKRNVRWRDGRAEVVTSHQSLDFEMVARGYEVWRGTLLPGQSVLRLRRAR